MRFMQEAETAPTGSSSSSETRVAYFLRLHYKVCRRRRQWSLFQKKTLMPRFRKKGCIKFDGRYWLRVANGKKAQCRSRWDDGRMICMGLVLKETGHRQEDGPESSPTATRCIRVIVNSAVRLFSYR